MGRSAGVAPGEGTGDGQAAGEDSPSPRDGKAHLIGKNSQFRGCGRERGVSPAWFMSKYIVLLLIASLISAWRFLRLPVPKIIPSSAFSNSEVLNLATSQPAAGGHGEPW